MGWSRVGDVMSDSLATRKGAFTRCARLAVVTLFAASLGVVTGCATGTQFVRGTVTAVAPARIQLKHKTGQTVSIELDQATTYRWDHAPASLADVLIGARVMVILQQARGPIAAQEVRIFTRPRAGP